MPELIGSFFILKVQPPSGRLAGYGTPGEGEISGHKKVVEL